MGKSVLDNLDFIVFAVKQAQEAERFGFTRNECCRNLKIAIHQYWQNKTIKMSGVSQKKNISRSKKAMGKENKHCIVEHVVPQMFFVDEFMGMQSPNKKKIEDILRKYFRVLLVTNEENKKLTELKLRSKMPDGWDREDIWARYKLTGIEPAEKPDDWV